MLNAYCDFITHDLIVDYSSVGKCLEIK